MNYRKQRRVRESIGWAVALSVGFHLLLCALFVLNVFNINLGDESTTPEIQPPVKEDDFEVTAVFEEDLEPEPEKITEPEPEPEPEEVAELKPEPEPVPEEVVEIIPEPEPEEVAELEPEPEPEEEQEEKETAELPPVDLNKLAVVQETNDELPVDAKHISDQANKVDEETVAEQTSMEEVEKPDEENANPMADAMAPTDPDEEDDIKAEDVILETAMPKAPVFNEPVVPAPAMVVQSKAEKLKNERAEEAIEKLEEIVEVEEGIGEVEKREPQEARDPKPAEVAKSEPPTPAQKPEKKFDPKSLFQADIKDYEKVFGGTDNKLREREHVDPKKRRLLKDWKDKEDVMRASLENFVQHVKPGNHTGVNASPAVYASYLARIHRRIHERYANDFIYHATHNIPGSHPLNRMDLNTLVEIVIDAKSGTIEQTNIIRSSGETLFDAETVLVTRGIGRHPNPPDEIVSKDGRVYVHWNFWRDSRQCGTFGAAVYLLNE